MGEGPVRLEVQAHVLLCHRRPHEGGQDLSVSADISMEVSSLTSSMSRGHRALGYPDPHPQPPQHHPTASCRSRSSMLINFITGRNHPAWAYHHPPSSELGVLMQRSPPRGEMVDELITTRRCLFTQTSGLASTPPPRFGQYEG